MQFTDHLDLIYKVCDAINTTSKSRYVFIADLETDVSRWSKNAVDFFGLPGETMEKAGEIWATHIHPKDRDSYIKSIEEIFSGEASSHIMNYRAMDKDGNYVTCSCDGRIIKDDNEKPSFFIGTITNHGISDNFDPTTGLPNQYFLFENMRTRHDEDETFLLEIFSIRHFHEINDMYGYSFGNNVLRAVAEKINEYINASGSDLMLYRLDGMRFALITGDMNTKILEDHHNNIKKILNTDIKENGIHIPIRIAAGAVISNNPKTDPQVLFSCARYALDLSKHKRHGVFVLYKDEYLSNNKRTIELMSEIRNCIDNNCKGFYLTFQPIVSAQNESLTGMETLLRWKSDEFGTVPPGEFLPWLETDDSFVELGYWIFEEAFKETLDIIKTHPDLILNVNIAYTQLERSDFRSSLVRILEETSFPPHNLCIELTERCRLLDMEFLRNEIIFLKSLGIKIALDDFGTGFSSLSLLKDLPVDTIKIDRGFILNLEDNRVDQSIIQAITKCARDIDLGICVEGIETSHMRDIIKNYPTTNFQGYFYSVPVILNDFKNLELYKSLEKC